jgi:1,4-alpha-glucan branching enzyme
LKKLIGNFKKVISVVVSIVFVLFLTVSCSFEESINENKLSDSPIYTKGISSEPASTLMIIFKNWNSGGTVYLPGDWNGWNPSGDSITVAPGATVTNIYNNAITAGNIALGNSASDLEFKVLNQAGNWNSAWSFSSWSLNNVSLSDSGRQVHVACEDGDVVTITFDVDGANSITATTAVSDDGGDDNGDDENGDGFTVFFKAPSGWNNTIRVYYWGGDSGTTSWPGEAMISEGSGWYSFSFSGTSTSLIFNNNGSPQTDDLIRSSDGWYMDWTWYDSDPEDEGGGENGGVTYSGRMGANLFDNGVEFSIWWRRDVVSDVWVSGDFNDWDKTPLTRITSGDNSDIWWTFVEGASAGDEYVFTGLKNGEEVVVADPYSQYNRYSSGSSVVVDHSDYTWSSTSWQRPAWEDYIIYELHVKDFTSSATDVTPAYRGKYLGMIEKLDYLTNLGITAIELMPISEFPDAGYSWGYNTSLYMAVESGYAVNPSAGQDGVDELKAFIDACHQYGIAVIVDLVFNHTANNDNWLWQIDNEAYFSGSTPWGNRLNTWHPQVFRLGRRTIEMLMNEYKVDGFRFDATHTSYMNHEFLYDLKNFAASIDPNVYFVYENLPNQDSLRTWGAQWAAEYRHRGRDLLCGWQHNGSDIDMAYFAQHIYYTKDHGWAASPVETVNYLESHDEDTLAYLFNIAGYNTGTQKAKTRLGAVMLATSLGNPMLWMGQEFLRAREGQNIDELPLDWSLLGSNGDVHNYYAGVFRLRRDNKALRDGNEISLQWLYTPWSAGNNRQVIAYSRISQSNPNDAKFVVALNNNFYDVSIWIQFPEAGTWTKVVTEGAVDQTITLSVPSNRWVEINVGSNSGIIFMK